MLLQYPFWKKRGSIRSPLVAQSEAIGLLETREDIRIVFTDINMPGSMDGLRLAHAIRHRWPPVELVYIWPHASSGSGFARARSIPGQAL